MNPSMEQADSKYQAEYVNPQYRRCGCRIDDSEQMCTHYNFENLEVETGRELTTLEKRINRTVHIAVLVVLVAILAYLSIQNIDMTSISLL